jgi:hypothetical protein
MTKYLQSRAGTSRELPREVRVTLERAQQLADSRPAGSYTTGWSHEALHVGDLSVLALALRD